MQPFLGDGRGQNRPIGFRVDPLVQLAAHLRLLEKEVLGLTHFQIGGAGDGRARLDQVGWLQLFGAVFTLIATGFVVAAIGAGALDIAVGQKAAIGVGIDLAFADFLDQASVMKTAREVLGQRVVLRRRRAPEMIEGQAKAFGDLGLNGVHLGTVFGDRLASLCGGQFGRCAMFVRGAQKHHLMAATALIAGV